MLLLLVAAFVSGGLVATFIGYKDNLLTQDGNLLFYNSPAVVRNKSEIFVSFITSNGIVKLERRRNGKKIASVDIHKYDSEVELSGGTADDHAAPAIIFDSVKKRVLVATAYHGTDMHIYEYILANEKVQKISMWTGRYTYPRFVKDKERIILVARNQKEKLSGDLIYRESTDNFSKEVLVLASGAGFVVYAGSVRIENEQLYYVYSKHDYEKGKLKGLTLSQFSLNEKKPIKTCELSRMLDYNYESNRPTGLGVKDGNITFGTAFFNKPVTYREAESKNFSVKHTVKVIKGNMEDCGSFAEVVSADDVLMPYYDASVAIDDDGNYLFFNKNKVITSIAVNDCFEKDNMIYPQFLKGGGIVYAVMDQKYSIRSFKNSINGCFKAWLL